MIRTVNQDDLCRSVFECLGGGQAAETPANNHDIWGAFTHNMNRFGYLHRKRHPNYLLLVASRIATGSKTSPVENHQGEQHRQVQNGSQQHMACTSESAPAP